MCAKFEKNLYVSSGDTSFLHKFKVVLNPTYRFLKEVFKMFCLPIYQK